MSDYELDKGDLDEREEANEDGLLAEQERKGDDEGALSDE
jgi:hypothetical protein